MLQSLALSVALASPAADGLLDSNEEDLRGFDIEVEADPIINGTPAALEQWPESGALLIEAEVFGTSFVIVGCSSTLIAPDTVLLAAHCVDPEVYASQFIDLNAATMYWSRQADLTSYASGTQTTLPADAVRVNATSMHPDFSMQTLQMGVTINSDIALMFLSQALVDNPMAVLPTVEEGLQLAVGNQVSVVGWGQQTTSQTEGIGLKVAGISHIAELGTHEFKVGEVTSDVRKCHGDSGGPSFMEIETESTETWRLVGVTSHAYDQTDCNSTGGVDTRVDPFLSWIDGEMQAACNDGRRLWCEVPGILPAPVAGDLEGEAKACGCSASPVSSLALAWLALPLIARRRT